ncbi:MAG: formate/nitrite transporter family protein [Phycisphaeraceae bacterium]
MAVAPNPSQIFKRALEEGQRRLDQTLLELTSNAFIAGLTIVFGMAALGMVESLVEPQFGELAKLAGALAFGVGLVFLVVGRTELFSENFFDPVASAFQRRNAHVMWRLLRLWSITIVLNLLGGALFVAILAVDGVLSESTAEVLTRLAEEIAQRGTSAAFVKAIVGGALVALLSFLLAAVNSIGSRIVLAYIVGFLLALGPFDHVIVTALHVLFGMVFGGDITAAQLAWTTMIATAGNLLGGLGLVTFTHIAQAKGAEESGW